MRTLVLFIFYAALILLLVPLVLLCTVLGIRKPILAVGKWAIRAGQRLLGIKLEVSGLENFDHEGTYVFMPNHTSLLDGPILFILIPQTIRVIIKKSVFRVPVLGLAMRLVGFIPVERKGESGGRKNIEKAARLMKEKKASFLVFPEGTRSREGGLQRFRRGGFFLAVMSGAPIVPVTIKGSFVLLPKGRFKVKKGTISVAFHAPVPSEGYAVGAMAELIDKVRDAVQSGLDEERDKPGPAAFFGEASV